jgi:hypothetical protein
MTGTYEYTRQGFSMKAMHVNTHSGALVGGAVLEKEFLETEDDRRR